MSTYRRPHIPHRDWRDEAGVPIPYGHRWEGSPPEESYSRESNTERYLPLHAIADALIAWMTDTFDVAVDTREGADAHPLWAEQSPQRVVTLTPASALAAPLAIAFDAFPGVIVAAGALYRAAFPNCGCDACDESVDDLADVLEGLVMSVVGGSFAEAIHGDVSEYVLWSTGGQGGGSGDGAAREDTDPLRWERAVSALAALARAGGPRLARVRDEPASNGLPAWHPWPRRAG